MKNLFTLLFSILTIFASAQEYPCSISYKHMSGVMNGKAVIMDLVIYDNQINGNCVFPDQDKENVFSADVIYTERLEGNIDEYNVATIKAFTGNIQTGVYSGFLGKDFMGTFRNNSGNRVGSFQLEENYEAGSIPFKGYCISKDSMLFDTLNSPFAHMHMKLLLPEEGTHTEALKAEVLKVYLGKELPYPMPDDSILYYFGMEYFSRYVNANLDIYDGGASFNWEIINSSYVSINYKGLLVYRIDSYAYTGGAHGMGVSRFLVFDNIKMEALSLSSIFKPHYEDSLSILLEEKYRSMYHLSDDQSLTDAGLFKDNIPPSNNFFIDENGIGFYYNPYKIAPYAMGSQAINLSWKQVAPLLKENAPVQRIIGSKQ